MFGLDKHVERVRHALIKAMRAKGIEIQTKHADKTPEQIPRNDLARTQVLFDLADILLNLRVEPLPGEK